MHRLYITNSKCGVVEFVRGPFPRPSDQIYRPHVGSDLRDWRSLFSCLTDFDISQVFIHGYIITTSTNN